MARHLPRPSNCEPRVPPIVFRSRRGRRKRATKRCPHRMAFFRKGISMADISRRDALRYGAAAAVSATTVAVGMQTIPAARSDAAPQGAAPAADPRDFDEV